MKKIIILLCICMLMTTGCNLAIGGLDVMNDSQYIVTSKSIKDASTYYYHLIMVGDSNTWYDYLYEDTTDFNVGDTLVVRITKINKN